MLALPPSAALATPCHVVVFTAAVVSGHLVHASDGSPVCGARLEGAFVESAPRDRFEFENRSAPGWRVARLTLDLNGSAGRLVFDTEDGGPGVEVFQPFRTESGLVRVDEVRAPVDGGERLALEFATDAPTADDDGAGAFLANEAYAFSIDVDDRLPDSELGQIRVSGSEIEGGRLSVEFVHDADGVVDELDGRFDANARIELAGTPCPD